MTTPAQFWLAGTETCPRCHSPADMVSIGSGLNYRCARCEWQWTFSAIAPTGLTSGTLTAGGTAITLTTPTTPTIPSTGVAATNGNAYTIIVTVAGGTMTGNTLVNGVSQGVSDGAFTVQPGATITISYSSAPSWTLSAAGTLFTASMTILLDTGANAEVLRVASGATATNLPLLTSTNWAGQVLGGLTKPHAASVAVGQLLLTPSLNGTGQEQVPANPGWGF